MPMPGKMEIYSVTKNTFLRQELKPRINMPTGRQIHLAQAAQPLRLEEVRVAIIIGLPNRRL